MEKKKNRFPSPMPLFEDSQLDQSEAQHQDLGLVPLTKGGKGQGSYALVLVSEQQQQQQSSRAAEQQQSSTQHGHSTRRRSENWIAVNLPGGGDPGANFALRVQMIIWGFDGIDAVEGQKGRVFAWLLGYLALGPCLGSGDH
jgi:hypothetical protein